MELYTPEEKREARTKLPIPIATFLGSQTLTDIYLGIKDKLKLGTRGLLVMCEIANATLLGLEDEHALETSLHQALPEMSNADMRELVADINDRVFKEAQRRLRENIVEPRNDVSNIVVDSEANGVVEQARSSDTNKDERRTQTPVAVAEKKNDAPVLDATPVAIRVPAKRPEEIAALSFSPAPVKTMFVPKVVVEQATVAPIFSSAIEEKLRNPFSTNAENVHIDVEKKGIQQVGMPGAGSETGIASPVQSSAPREYKGTDPYRETIE